MATITLKNIPDDLYARLKQSARGNRRSINSEIIVCLERTMLGRRVDLDAVLKRARRFRDLTQSHVIGDEEFNAAKTAGRP